MEEETTPRERRARARPQHSEARPVSPARFLAPLLILSNTHSPKGS